MITLLIAICIISIIIQIIFYETQKSDLKYNAKWESKTDNFRYTKKLIEFLEQYPFKDAFIPFKYLFIYIKLENNYIKELKNKINHE